MRKSFVPLLVIFCFLLSATSLLRAQTSWEKLFSQKSTDVFRCVIEASAGGYIAAGYTSDSTVNDTDAYVVRLNVNGDTLWTKKYNYGPGSKDLYYKVINATGNTFLLCGYSTGYNGSDDAIWAKMDANGNILWTYSWGGVGKERAQDIQQTSDGGYAIAGYTTSPPALYYDAFLIKTDNDGILQWQKKYGGSGFEDANSLRQLPDGGYILGGQASGSGGLDMSLMRINASGDTLWTRKFGTAGTDNIESVYRLSSGDFVLAGGTDGAGAGGNDGYLVKTDSGGAVLWTRTYGGNDQDDFHRVEETSDNGFILSGTSRSSGALLPNMWLVKTNSAGDSLWTRTFGGNNHDHGYSAVQTSDGGYIFAGYSSSFAFNGEDGYIVKTDASGDVSNLLTYISITALASPLSYTCANASTPVKVVIRNFGNDTVPNVPVTIQITGSLTQTINQTYNGAVHPGEVDTFLLSTPINTSGGGTYNFYCFSGNTNDVIPARNSFSTTVFIPAYSATPTVTNGSRCGTGSVTLTATSPDSIFWYNAPTSGTLVGIGSPFNTPSIATTTTYYAQAGMACPSSRVAATASVLSTPVNPVTTNASRCGSGTLTLTASATDPVLWFDASSGGTQVGSGNSFTTPSLTSTTTYYAEANNGTCSSGRISATATINVQSADPVVTPASRCGSGTVDLTATASDPISWYDASSGGNLVGTGGTFITPVLTSTTTYYAEASNGTCPSARVAGTATINTVTPDPVVTDGSHCGPGTVTLSASSVATVIWYPTSSGGTQLGTGSSFTTPSISSTTTYYVQATDGICPSAFVPVQAVINPNPVVNLGNDTTVFALSYTLDAGPGYANYSWSTTEQTQTIDITAPGNYCVTVTDNNTCTGSDCIYVDLIIGIRENGLAAGIRVYPNPAGEQVQFEFPNVFTGVTVWMISSSGQLISREYLGEVLAGSVHTLDLSSLAKGMYLVRLESSQGGFSRILLKD